MRYPTAPPAGRPKTSPFTSYLFPIVSAKCIGAARTASTTTSTRKIDRKSAGPVHGGVALAVVAQTAGCDDDVSATLSRGVDIHTHVPGPSCSSLPRAMAQHNRRRLHRRCSHDHI